MKILLILLLSCSDIFAISLSWTANPPEQVVTQYKVYRVRKNTADLMTTVNAPTVTCNIDAYLNSSRTKFYITAVNFAGESLKSGTVTVQRH